MSYAPSSAFPRAEISLDGPTIPAPAGYVSNLNDPPNGNNIAIPVITVCVIFSAIFYAIRFYAKFLGKKINVADYLSFVAFPIFWVYVYYSYSLSWTSGYLVHEWDIRLRDIPAFSFVCWIATLLYLWVIALVKCAILLEWVDIFGPKGKSNYFTWTCYATCFAISTLSAIIFIMDLVNCTPFEANWDPLVPGAFCRFSIPRFGLASSSTNFILDMVPLILAQKVIWGLRMSWKKKVGVSAIFFIGIIGCASSLVRLYFATRFFESDDTTYFFSIMALCSLCETTCAHLILCVPFTLKAVAGIQQTKLFTELKSYMSLRSTSTYTNNSNASREGTGLPRHVKLDEHSSLGSRGTNHDPKYSEDSEKTFYRPDAV